MLETEHLQGSDGWTWTLSLLLWPTIEDWREEGRDLALANVRNYVLLLGSDARRVGRFSNVFATDATFQAIHT